MEKRPTTNDPFEGCFDALLKAEQEQADKDKNKPILHESGDSNIHKPVPPPQIKMLNTYFKRYWICMAAGLPLCILLIGIPIVIVGVVFAFILLYQLWKLIPADIARTTPGKAIGFCFIPFFNIYWIFVAFKGLGEDMNKTLQSRGIQYQVSEGLGLACCILFLCCMIPYLGLLTGIPTIIVWIFFFKSVKDGAIALLEQGM